MIWVKDHVIAKPGNEILTSTLYSRYKSMIEKTYTEQGIINDTVFFKEIAGIMSIFSIKATKIRLHGGRG